MSAMPDFMWLDVDQVVAQAFRDLAADRSVSVAGPQYKAFSALLRHGLEITGLEEHDCIPWEALPGQMVVDERGEWRLKEAPWRLPLSYTLQAVKRLA